MGSRTDADIAAWQKAARIEPAAGEHLEALNRLSNAAFEAIKIIELEKSGIRDGDGYWHGSDVIGGMTRDLISLCERLVQPYGKRDAHNDSPPDKPLDNPFEQEFDAKIDFF
jgi:hypothetical protein